MAEKQTVTIESIKDGDQWINIKTADGREIGIKKDKNPKLAKYFRENPAETGSSLELMVNEWNGKWFGSDLVDKPAGGKFPAAKKNLALECLDHACVLHSLRKDSTAEQVIADAEKLLEWVKKKE